MMILYITRRDTPDQGFCRIVLILMDIKIGDIDRIYLKRIGVIGDYRLIDGTHHREYIEAGCDIIETNSFGANVLVQEDYGLGQLAPQMAFAAAKLAREEADAAARKLIG